MMIPTLKQWLLCDPSSTPEHFNSNLSSSLCILPSRVHLGDVFDPRLENNVETTLYAPY